MIKQPSGTSAPQAPPQEPAAEPQETATESKGAEVSEQIGHKLRAMFDDVIAEPVPEKFRQLIEELERKSGKR